MSSVKERIRNLQQSTNPQPSKSVAERAKGVERVSDPNAEQPKTLSQLKKHFDSEVTTESGGALGARVARFDSDASQSLKDRVRRLESDTSDIGSISARASAFELSGRAVKDVAGQFSEQQQPTDGDTAALQKARAIFEVGNKDKSVETTLSTRKISSEDKKQNVNINVHSAQTSATKPSKLMSSSSTTSQDDFIDGVSRRTAIFERAESESKPNVVSPTQRDPPRTQPSIQPAKIGGGRETSNANASKGTDEKSLRDELREVRRTNEELVSVLLEMTAAFRHLEGARDELQKRIAELEKR